MLNEEKIKLLEQLQKSDKYKEKFRYDTSGRNDHDFSYSNTVIYHSEEFKIWVTVRSGAKGRRGKRHFFDIIKSYSNPRAQGNEDEFDHPF